MQTDWEVTFRDVGRGKKTWTRRVRRPFAELGCWMVREVKKNGGLMSRNVSVTGDAPGMGSVWAGMHRVGEVEVRKL